ncbi:MAG: hypothetical protein FJY76_02390 [Candidatus Aenigmarchaeota archaeon]|nr:hypothetical protein [Candidatus Aenigmarchaeota archaeon]
MIHRVRKTRVTRNEIIADLIFFFVPALIALIALYVFDIHWNFYPGGSLFPPMKYIFTDPWIYVSGTLVGGFVGFFLIKLVVLGIHEEEAMQARKTKK